MANELMALVRQVPAAAAEDDYRSFCAALESSARGRAFLAEYARRNRKADTEVLLAALARLEGRLRADGSALARLRDELRVLLIAIRLARPEIDATNDPAKAPANEQSKAEKLGRLLDLMERRIEAMVDDSPVPLAASGVPEPPAARAPRGGAAGGAGSAPRKSRAFGPSARRRLDAGGDRVRQRAAAGCLPPSRCRLRRRGHFGVWGGGWGWSLLNGKVIALSLLPPPLTLPHKGGKMKSRHCRAEVSAIGEPAGGDHGPERGRAHRAVYVTR